MPTSRRLRLGLVAVVLGIGAGILTDDPSGGSAGAAPVGTSDAVQRRADVVYRSFAGSKLERDAGEVLAAYALNGAMDRCMERAGFPEWDWSMPRAQNPTSHGLETSDFFAAPRARTFSTTTLESAASAVADRAARTVRLSAAERAAVDRCEGRTPATSDEAAAPTPPEAARLRDQWWTMIRALDDRYGDELEYAECLAARPIPGLGRVTSDDEATMALSALEPAPDRLPTSGSDPKVRSAAWQRLLAAEAAWERVDWACRETTYDDHADEIERAERAWARTLDRAQDLGFRGSYGPID